MTTIKKEIKDSSADNYSATVDYMEQINKSFQKAFKDERKKKRHQQFMDAVLSAWLSLMFANFEEDIAVASELGIAEADRQLIAKNITKKVDKSITEKTYKNQIAARTDSVKSDLVTVAEEVKSNNSKVFRDLSQTITKEQREKLSNELLDILKKNGVTYFTDKAGRKWDIAYYVKMRTMTELAQAQRLSFFTRATQYGVDLVKIVHLNIHPQCELCSPFNNKVLSINGRTEGYMTIQEASSFGLFHPSCDHIPQHLELQPTNMGGEEKIKVNEKNKKRQEYNKKKGFNMF